jgi:MFS superfamily sulfate permease-like transporter
MFSFVSGAATPAAGFFASLVVLFAILFMLPLLHTLPQPVIASIIVVVTAGIIDIQELLLVDDGIALNFYFSANPCQYFCSCYIY